MKNKNRNKASNKLVNLSIVLSVLLISIGIGYTLMGIKTRNKKNTDNIVISKETIDKDTLNFSDYLYDIDGNEVGYEVSGKIIDDKLVIYINEEEYVIDEIISPKSIRIDYCEEGDGYNVIYVVNDSGYVYQLKDIELIKHYGNKAYILAKKLDIENAVAISTVMENDLTKGYKYPALCVKLSDGSIYVSKYNEEFYELK